MSKFRTLKSSRKSKGSSRIVPYSLQELHRLFTKHPELEDKYLNSITLPITGKETIYFPYDFINHRNNTCLDFSPYGNQQISKTTCTVCDKQKITTVSDSTVAFIEQSHNVMKFKSLYCSIQKNRGIFPLYIKFPHLFQIYFLIQDYIPESFPIIYAKNEIPHMCIVFEKPSLHLSCQCISTVIQVYEFCDLSLHMHRDHLTLHVMTLGFKQSSVNVNAEILEHKIEEMDISDDTKECYDKYYSLLVSCKVIPDM
ncbi:docking/lamella protein U37 [Elephant endotheliotropic herpesvirus 5B]|uniref:Nuclear egress lamina protein n=1 Tax=Elephant endotheliotropic herpesvirus 5 TaxID=768738 RepID=A0A075CYK7_9BETA|nr:nuclear egress lamina protein [Elephant endotheliotropic herpesvirus 5]AHC02782.1 nuclear egress lamina protein [Elephant endotheliotropic herpesvirus 5]UVZ35240.1 docking/lamella protein U37 [Elephant endotheliotropic herpesvirus 5B]